MTGTLINIVAVIIGSALGLLIGHRLSTRIQESVMTGLGLVTLVLGMQSAWRSGNIVIPLLSLASGAIVGELLDLDGSLKRFGGWLQSRSASTTETHSADEAMQARARFINAFVTSSLVFCVGPLTILGPIQNGINGADIQILVIKSTLDFFSSIAFAASLGIGVAFSVIPLGLLQGSFALVGMGLVGALAAGSQLTATNPYIRELTGTGGLILLGLALILLNIKQPRVANFLPALLIAPLLVWIATLLGINIYPL
ncbi:MAG: DUF554 domain-containing protein [Chloroflexota bacterium]